MTITYIKAVAATLTNNTKTITVTGEQVDFSKANDYLVALDNGLYVLAVASGTAPDGNGDSTLTLVDTWAGATLSNKSLLIFPTFAKIYESVAAMTALNDVTRGILTKLQSLLTDTNPTLDIAVGQTSTITTVPYGYLTNQVTALIAQLNGLVGSVQAMTKPEFDRNRLNELNNFPVSGHLKVDKSTGFEFQQIAGWENQFKIKASETKIDGVWHKYADTTITNFDAPNGLQNKDLVTADFANLAAAIVSGGTDLSQSYLNQRVVVYAMQDDIIAAPAQTTAYVQDPTNNFYADDGVLRQRIMTFETERFLETVEQKTGQLFTNSVNAMTSLGWALSANTLGEFEKDGKKAAVFGIVNSRTKASYHPSFTPEGTATFDTGSGRVLWFDVSVAATDKSYCFSNVGVTSGDIVGNNKGRSDGKFYDAIYTSDFEDCRMSALQTPKAELRENHKRRAIAGQVEGVEGVPFTKFETFTRSNSGFSSGSTWIYSAIENLTVNIGDVATGDIGRIVGASGTVYKVSTCTTTGPQSLLYLQSQHGNVSSDFPTGDYTLVNEFQQTHVQTKPEWTGIMGDPVNIASLFTTVGSKFFGADGIEGQWIPDLTAGSVERLLNRKWLSDADSNGFNTIDNGVTWGTGNYAMTTTANTVLVNVDGGRVILLNYETQAHFTKDAVNSRVLTDITDVQTVVHNDVRVGTILASSLIDKVTVGTNNADKGIYDSVNRYGVFSESGLLDANGIGITHDIINLLSTTSPAVKLSSYLSSSNNVGLFMMLYKELIYDGSTAIATNVSVGVSRQYNEGESYVFDGLTGSSANFNDIPITFMSTLTVTVSAGWFDNIYIAVDGYLRTSTTHALANPTMKIADGNGWGDNSKFEPKDNQETFTDYNGNTGLRGTALTEMQHFIIEE